jgi:hypothetical protein
MTGTAVYRSKADLKAIVISQVKSALLIVIICFVCFRLLAISPRKHDDDSVLLTIVDGVRESVRQQCLLCRRVFLTKMATFFEQEK